MTDFNLIIDGRKVATAQHQDVLNPSTGAVVGGMPVATAENLDAAVAAAGKAFSTWSQTVDAARAEACRRIAEAIEATMRRNLRTCSRSGTGQTSQWAWLALRNRRRCRPGRATPPSSTCRSRSLQDGQRARRAAPQADRRRRLDHAVELAGDDRLLAHHPGDPRRQHCRHQAFAANATEHDPPCRDHQRSPAARRRQRRHRRQ